ncbi:sigma factor [Actinoplanes sp. CA-142083]|uniref:sigma factor n=1 Tax=Actinoplanes sp. CA-142083 TaxID=3239903 RepID=UPI003D92D58C
MITVVASASGLVEPLDRAPAEFESVRSRLFGIAHRIVGCAADAEDVVQDAWIRWQTADRAAVRSPTAFLVTATRRLALNTVTSAHARREVCAGGWLPDLCVAADPEPDGGEALKVAIQLLMEQLSAVECAVYVLYETFGYPFREIAGVLELSEVNARQLAHRARRHLREGRHQPVDPAERDRLLRAFVRAARGGDMPGLVDHLSQRIFSCTER